MFSIKTLLHFRLLPMPTGMAFRNVLWRFKKVRRFNYLNRICAAQETFRRLLPQKKFFPGKYLTSFYQ